MRRLIVSSLFLFSSIARADAGFDAVFSQGISPTAPGAAVLVVQDGQIAFEKGYGLANLAAGTPIKADTLFNLASDSKQFTGMAVAMLIERGLIRLDDPLRKFIPELPSWADPVQIKHLLYHSSGLPDYTDAEHFCDTSAPMTNLDVISYMASKRALKFTPGSRFDYDNSGYATLAVVVERASGTRFPDFLRDTIFKPLGMTSTLVNQESSPSERGLAESYETHTARAKAVPYTACERVFGDGSVYSSVKDLFHWTQALEHSTLVSPATQQLIFTAGALNDGTSAGYGFGWSVDSHKGQPLLDHSGEWLGFESVIDYVPAQKTWVIVLSNADDLGDPIATEALQAIDLEAVR